MKHSTLRKLCTATALLAAVVLALPLLGELSRWRRHWLRRQWKEQAIPEIARRAGDPGWVSREVARLAVPTQGCLEKPPARARRSVQPTASGSIPPVDNLFGDRRLEGAAASAPRRPRRAALQRASRFPVGPE